MNIVVTGGAGFIGSHITNKLVSKGHTVTVVDNLRRGTLENLKKIRDEIDFQEIDILDYDKLKTVMKNADGVFHQAALGSVEESWKHPEEYHCVNVVGTENIFKLAKQFGFKVLFSSSASVYGHPKKIPIKENFERKPTNPYGTSKLKAEQAAERFSKQGVKIICLRYFNVYGIGQNKNYAGVILKFIENLVQHKPPLIHGDGSQVRNFIFLDDVVEANMLAFESSVDDGFINIASSDSISITELAKMMIRLSGLDLKSVYDDPIQGDIEISHADINLARELLGWTPKTSLEEGLRKILPKIN